MKMECGKWQGAWGKTQSIRTTAIAMKFKLEFMFMYVCVCFSSETMPPSLALP